MDKSLGLTVQDIETLQCEDPGCVHEGDKVYLSHLPHRGEPVFVSYKNGVLTLTCSVCRAVVTRIVVAESTIH